MLRHRRNALARRYRKRAPSRSAIERYHMNLGLPHVHKAADGRILNDYLRRKDVIDPANTSYLTGELFAQFATRVGR